MPPTLETLGIGLLVKHFTYDAYGRLIRVQSPFPTPEESGGTSLRTERLYYDGVRRIQEVYVDPTLSMNLAMAGGGGVAMQAAANQVELNAEMELDGSATPSTLESQQLSGEIVNLPTTVTYLNREYVWGPGDWGVDELLVQYDAARRASWPLQDAGGDVIALCDRGGTGTAARVVTQITYDAYGNVLGRDNPAGPSVSVAELHVGHKGLFFDRLDLGIVDPSTGAETPRLAVGAMILGENRNRTLYPAWGRFMQRDPNATGLVVQQSLGYHGNGMSSRVPECDLRAHVHDGANAVQYARSNPITGFDALGLEVTYLGQIQVQGGIRTVQAGMQGTYQTIGMASRASSLFGQAGMGAGGLAGGGYGGAVGTLSGWGAAAAYTTVGVMIFTGSGIMMTMGSMGGDLPGEQALPSENGGSGYVPAWVGDGGSLVNHCLNLQRERRVLTAAEADELVELLRQYNVYFRLDPPHPNTNWNAPHLNIGNSANAHVLVPPGWSP